MSSYDNATQPDLFASSNRAQHDVALANHLRDEGLAAVATRNDDWFNSIARRKVLHIAEQMRPFTTDDVRDPSDPEPPSPRAYAPVVTALAREGIIVAVGARKSTRPTAHRAWLTLWAHRDVAAEYDGEVA